MSINVPALLNGLLEATAAEAAAKARIATFRAALEDEARRRYSEDGAAPTWTAPKLGKARLEPETDYTATVQDAAAFGSYVAENHPSEATAVLRIPAGLLDEALEALRFAGFDDDAGSTCRPAVDLEVRPAWATPFLESLHVDVERDPGGYLQVTAVDSTGQQVPGLTARRSEAKLVVNLDRDRRTAVIEEARQDATGALIEATGVTPEELTELDTRRRALEALTVDQLATIAAGHGLGKSGTKAALAERIARAEAATGHVIDVAANLPPDPSGADAPPTTAPEATIAERADELEAAATREELRGIAKRRGLPAAGTKRDVAIRLAEVGVTITAIDLEETPA